MKKLLLVCAALAAVIFMNAQIGIASLSPKKPYAESSNGIRFGIKAGANFYQIGGSDADDEGLDQSRKLKVGFAGGFLANIPFSEMFSFQPEVLYSTEGNLQEESGVKLNIALSYINVPLMVQYNNPSGFYAETGPQVGFLTSAKVKITDNPDDDVKDQLKGIGFSWALGAGYRLQNGFGIGARYNLGLTTIDDSDPAEKLTSNGFHIGIHYLFNSQK